MRVVVSSFGSAGDFVPALAVGAALARRGHHVRFVGNPYHEQRVRNAGVEFIGAGARCDLDAVIVSEPAYARTTGARRLLSDRGIGGRAAEIGVRQRAERDGAEVAADEVERLSLRGLWPSAASPR